MNKWNLYLKLVIFIVFSVASIGIEFYYRQRLFDFSLSWIKEQQTNSSETTMKFFKFITEFGSQGLLIPIIVLTYLLLSLNKAYLFLSITILAISVDCIMKMIYGDPRPFWIENSLYKACDGGFGNPSGHSYSSSAFYLTLAHILTDYDFFKKRIYIRIFVYFLFIGLIITILISRLFLGVHSINQILYGSTLGSGLYFLFIHIFQIHAMSGEEFFDLFTNQVKLLLIGFFHATMIATSLLVYFLVTNDTSTYEANLSKLCPDLNPYRKFNNDGLYGCLTLFALIGAHYGILFMLYFLKKINIVNLEAILHWNKTKWIYRLYIIGLLICFASPLLATLLISGKTDLLFIFIFKVSLPYLLACFGIYGLNVYFSIKLKIANPLLIPSSLKVISMESANLKSNYLEENNIIANVNKKNGYKN